MNRRIFSKTLGVGSLSILGMGVGCTTKTASLVTETQIPPPFFKLSLAQWSLHKETQAGKLDPFHFAQRAQGLGFEGLEYVSGLYYDWLKQYKNQLAGLKLMSKQLLAASNETGMKNLLIMIDGQGDLGIQDKAKRIEGIENHKKWIDMADRLGCHSIRLNLFGEGPRKAQMANAADSMSRLADYAKDVGINILVENHGGLSSDPTWVTAVMKATNRSNVGTLPDFGNFCIEREGGARWGAPCVNEYDDIYKAVEMMMPYAKAVSAKSYAFDANGNETKIDYTKMLQIVKDAGYSGYIGVEYEGEENEEQGILATRNLLIKAAQKLT